MELVNSGTDKEIGCGNSRHHFEDCIPQLCLVGAHVLTNASKDEGNEISSYLLHKHLQVEEGRYPEAGDKDDGRTVHSGGKRNLWVPPCCKLAD